MTRGGQFEKWASVLLGIVCVALVLNLAFLRGGARANSPRSVAAASPARAEAGPGSPAMDDLRAYDPVLMLETWNALQSRKLPKLERNPFDFRRAPAPPPPPRVETPVAPPVPAGPPPIPLKALGYTEKSPGVPEAIVTDDDQIYIVHEGETFARKYRVLKITPTGVEVEDETTQQKARLPIAP
jgi:hypothetical protein